MSESNPTKEELSARNEVLQAENERLRGELAAENERLRGELAAARAGAGSPARVTLAATDPNFLSEGDRQAMEINGVVTSAVTGRRLLASDFGIKVKTEEGRRNLERAQAQTTQEREGIRGVDYVYPSIARGVLDPEAPVRGAQPASAVEPAAVTNVETDQV